MIRRAPEAALLLLLAAGAAHAAPAVENDYPTSARVDYVIGCMAANGQSREAMTRCACSVDTLASILPYDRYVAAETILSMRQGVGQAASIFRNTPQYDDVIADLRRAQAEAEVQCFK
ncbi:hypothetical protein V5F59_22160 [Xanthobacter autotrophicus DSM 431]|uniref:hypothetical protein n=1 Tax=Xanthobacter nonsaccharivorans TaxID=3119912 RepID=UPI003726D821